MNVRIYLIADKGVRKGEVLGYPPLSLIFYKNFITFPKEINSFCINLSTS